MEVGWRERGGWGERARETAPICWLSLQCQMQPEAKNSVQALGRGRSGLLLWEAGVPADRLTSRPRVPLVASWVGGGLKSRGCVSVSSPGLGAGQVGRRVQVEGDPWFWNSRGRAEAEPTEGSSRPS